MTTPVASDLNAPPGGGPNATVVATSQPPVAPPVVTDPLLITPKPAGDAAPAPVAPVATPAKSDVPDLGDPGLNVAADYFVNTLGLSMDSPEIVEAAKGNYSYLEAKIAQLGDKAKGAETFVKLAQDAQGRMSTTQEARHAAAVKTVHEAVGGEANWQAVRQFASTNLTPEQADSARAALSQGGFAAEAMAKHLMALATQHPQTTVVGATPVNNNAPAVPLVAQSPLTREQYRAEYKKLVAQHGIVGVQKQPELAALNARLIRS